MVCSHDRVHDYAYDLLPEEDAATIRRHVADCPGCGALVEGYVREASFWEKALAVEPSASVEHKFRRNFALALVAAGCFVAAVIAWLAGVFGGGDESVRVTYRLNFTDEPVVARPSLAIQAQGVVQRRLAAVGLEAARVELDGENRLVISVLPTLRARLEDADALIVRRGRLEFREVADRGTQERYVREGHVPAGYEVFEAGPAVEMRQPEYEAWRGLILVRKEATVIGHHIRAAEARQQLGIGGPEWITTFELNDEGARRFDEKAARLFAQEPPGMIAIVLEGKLRSLPVVRSASFHGKGHISGAKNEQDAKDLAIVLRSGELPVPLKR